MDITILESVPCQYFSHNDQVLYRSLSLGCELLAKKAKEFIVMSATIWRSDILAV